MPALTLCTVCGEPCVDGRCTEHRPTKPKETRRTFRQKGYDSAWDRLSKRARTIQPWCTDCGRPDDLTADHLRWPARNLNDVDVVCRECNSKRGETPRDGQRHTGRGAYEPLPGPRGMAFSSTQSDTEYANRGSEDG